MALQALLNKMFPKAQPNLAVLEIPEIATLRQLLIENGIDANSLIIKECILYYESAGDQEVYYGFRLDHQMLVGPCLLMFDWNLSDLFVGWCSQSQKYYLTGRNYLVKQGEGVFFDKLNDLAVYIAALSVKVKLNSRDY
jgi:hypothetical protein